MIVLTKKIGDRKIAVNERRIDHMIEQEKHTDIFMFNKEIFSVKEKIDEIMCKFTEGSK